MVIIFNLSSFPFFHFSYLFGWWICYSLNYLRCRMIKKKRCVTIKILTLNVWSSWKKVRYDLNKVVLAVPIEKICWCFLPYQCNSEQGLREKMIVLEDTLLTWKRTELRVSPLSRRARAIQNLFQGSYVFSLCVWTVVFFCWHVILVSPFPSKHTCLLPSTALPAIPQALWSSHTATNIKHSPHTLIHTQSCVSSDSELSIILGWGLCELTSRLLLHEVWFRSWGHASIVCVMDILGTSNKYGFKENDVGEECGFCSQQELGVTSSFTACWLCDSGHFSVPQFSPSKSNIDNALRGLLG